MVLLQTENSIRAISHKDIYFPTGFFNHIIQGCFKIQMLQNIIPFCYEFYYPVEKNVSPIENKDLIIDEVRYNNFK